MKSKLMRAAGQLNNKRIVTTKPAKPKKKLKNHGRPYGVRSCSSVSKNLANLAAEAETSSDRAVLLTDVFLDSANDIMGIMYACEKRFALLGNQDRSDHFRLRRRRILSQKRELVNKNEFNTMAILINGWKEERNNLLKEYEQALHG